MVSLSTLILTSMFLVLIGNYLLDEGIVENMENCDGNPATNGANITVLQEKVDDLVNEVQGLSKVASKNSESINSLSQQVKGFQKAAYYKAKYSSK